VSLPKSIGIKLYDGSFVPVLTEEEVKCKKLLLTTVKDNQKKAVIELYEGTSDECINNEYLGKLVIAIDRHTVKGDPGIEVNLRLNDEGMLYAKAWDIDSGAEAEIKIEHSHSERIFKDELSRDEIETISRTSQTKNIESLTEDELLDDYQKQDTEEIQTEVTNKKDFLPLLKSILIILIVAVIVVLLGFGIFFVGKKVSEYINYQNNLKIEEMKKIEKENQEKQAKKDKQNLEDEKIRLEQEKLEKERLEKEKLEKQKLEQLKREKEEAELKIKEQEKLDKLKKDEEKVVKKDKKDEIKGVRDLKGKKHFIRKGQNLWNICKKYYSDPWYYPDLAKVNGIKNPRKIYAGTYMIIPPKSSLKRWDFKK